MSDWNMKSYMTRDADSNIRRHQSDWHKKITLSLACIIFFFIGAPLGAIIRKGGLGMPVVISVLIFVLYYIIDSGATRVAKSGEMNIVLGTWMSTIILAPLGGFLTYKSNKDSVVFNIDVVCKLLPQAVRNKSITPRFQERGYYPHTRLYPHLSGFGQTLSGM